jgi:hypothetical protein
VRISDRAILWPRRIRYTREGEPVNIRVSETKSREVSHPCNKVWVQLRLSIIIFRLSDAYIRQVTRQYSKQRDGRQSELFKNVCEKFAIAKIKELNLLGACLDVVSIRFGFIRNLTTSIYYLFVVFYSAIHNKLRRYSKPPTLSYNCLHNENIENESKQETKI